MLPISACQSHQPTIGRPWCKWRPCWFRYVCHPQNPPNRLTFKALTTMKLLVLMWLLLQPSSTHLKEKSLAYSMNMPILGRDHPFIHQANLNGLRQMLMKNLSKLVVPNLSLLWMDILSLSSSRMV